MQCKESKPENSKAASITVKEKYLIVLKALSLDVINIDHATELGLIHRIDPNRQAQLILPGSMKSMA